MARELTLPYQMQALRVFAGDVAQRAGAGIAERVAALLLEHLLWTQTSGKVHMTALKMARRATHPLLAGALMASCSRVLCCFPPMKGHCPHTCNSSCCAWVIMYSVALQFANCVCGVLVDLDGGPLRVSA